MTQYLHGVKTEEQSTVNIVIQDADISNVCIIGTKPDYLINNSQDIDHIVNFTDAAQYIGSNISGFTLPDAVDTVLKESGGASIYTINIFNKEKHTSTVTKNLEFVNGEVALSEKAIFDLKLKTTGEDGEELVLNENYAFENNTITLLDDFSNATISATYSYADFSKITDSDIIGSTDAQGARSGIQKIHDINAIYGVTPGIIIAPGFTSKNVRSAIQSIADKIEAIAYLDCDKDTNVAIAQQARLKETNGIDLTGWHERTYLSSTWVTRYNSFEDKDILQPYSPVLAGQRVKLDRQRNIAKSIDNTVSTTTKSTKYPISFGINDPDCDANRLSAQGLGTVINHNGEYRTWGSRNSSFPKNSGLMTFEAARRTRDFINKSIRETSFYCVGESITRGFIDDVLNAINAAFARWQNPLNSNEHIIYGGEAYYDPAKNTAENLANGKITFSYKECVLSVAESITMEDIQDITIIVKTLNA